MTTILLAPKPFTVISANEQSIAPVKNMGVDEPGFVWRSNDLSSVTFKVLLDGTAWDTFALVDNNLRSGDTIRIRAGASSTVVDGTTSLTVDQTFTAWSGTAPTGGALSFRVLGSTVTSAYVRIDITSGGNPAGYVQAARLAFGKRVVTDGVNIGANQTFEDTSVIEEGPGFTTVDEYGVRIGWEVGLEGITDANYNANWFPFLRAVGRKKAFVFIPDDASAYVQTQAMLARIVSSAKGTSPVADYNVVELKLLSVS